MFEKPKPILLGSFQNSTAIEFPERLAVSRLRLYMTLYYDPFDAEEEDFFLESEAKRGCVEIEVFVRRVEANDPSLTTQHFDFTMSAEQFHTVLAFLPHANFLKKLDFTHWGLLLHAEDDVLVMLFTQLLSHKNSQLESLGLRSCGITGTGIHRIWEFLTANRTIQTLNLSRNMLGGIYHKQNLNYSFRTMTSKITSLKELNLSATGLKFDSLISLMDGLQQNTTLQTLDISNNFDSLESLLEHLLPYLPNMKGLRRLILTKGASSSTCIDSQVEDSLLLLQRVVHAMEQNSSFCMFGPLFILPIDRHANTATRSVYHDCMKSLERIQFYLKRNQLRPIIASITGGKNCDRATCMYPSYHLSNVLAMANNDPAVLQYVLSETAGFCLG
eukprot:scaffold1501_cov130-Cylindrotheca_fusiformis.AAC.15